MEIMKDNGLQKTSTIDLVMTIAGWLGLFLLWYLVLSNYNTLPDIIPTHYNARGEVDGYGSKKMIFLLPVVGTIIFIGMSILVRHPTEWNYYSKVTPEKAAYHYSWAKTIINYYNFAIAFAFCIIVYETIAAAQNASEGFGVWTLLIPLALFLGPMPYFLIRIFRSNP